jgi:hypothetical protein
MFIVELMRVFQKQSANGFSFSLNIPDSQLLARYSWARKNSNNSISDLDQTVEVQIM